MNGRVRRRKNTTTRPDIARVPREVLACLCLCIARDFLRGKEKAVLKSCTASDFPHFIGGAALKKRIEKGDEIPILPACSVPPSSPCNRPCRSLSSGAREEKRI